MADKKNRTPKISDTPTGRAPRATNLSNFYQTYSEYAPRSGVERAPRPQPRSNVPDDASSNHNDLIRGNGY